MGRVEEIRARLDKATLGPWKHTPGVAFKHYVHSTDEREEFGFSLQTMHWRDGEPCRAEENAELIAHIPADLRWALGEIDRLRKALEDCIEICDTNADYVWPESEIAKVAREALKEAPDA